MAETNPMKLAKAVDILTTNKGSMVMNQEYLIRLKIKLTQKL